MAGAVPLWPPLFVWDSTVLRSFMPSNLEVWCGRLGAPSWLNISLLCGPLSRKGAVSESRKRQCILYGIEVCEGAVTCRHAPAPPPPLLTAGDSIPMLKVFHTWTGRPRT